MKRSCGSSARGVGPLLLLPVQAALMVGLGRLVTGPAAGHWPLSAEASIGRDLAEDRDPAVSGVTELFSVLAGTQAVIGATLVCIVVLLVLPRVALRSEALFLGVSVAAQSAVFVVVTAFVDRPRPSVPHEDAAPPTSSFPVLVVRHPYGCPDELADRPAAVLHEHGHRDLRWILTSAELPCGALAQELRTVRPALVVVRRRTAMLITVSRSGGFTGIDKMRKIDTSVRRDAAEWEGLARRAVRPVADGFHYRITVDGQTVDLDEAGLTGDQRELIRAVLGEGA